MAFPKASKSLVKTRSFILLLFGGLISIAQVHAQEWEPVKSEDGVEVFNREVEGSDFKEFRSVGVMPGEVASFVALIHDIDGMTSWGYKLKKTELLEQDGDTRLIYFAEASAPFPYKNRFGIYENEFSWDKDNQTLTVDIELLEDYPYDSDDLVMLKGTSKWIVKDLGNGKIEVAFQMLIDPGKGIPAWLANMVSDESPLQTIFSVREEVVKKKYQGKSFDFLNN